jgi:SAM-dependent methyltransferase
MAGPWAYDLMYRTWAPWDAVGVRQDLVALLDRGVVDPGRHPRSIDLGCGTGANVVYLAQQGFESWGVDFSKAAIGKGRRRARHAGVEARFVVGDLTLPSIDGVDGPFDLLIDFGTLDDLTGEARRKMADTITLLSRPGSVFFEYCFYGERDSLPWLAMGASKFSHIAPGELEALFGESWEIEPFASYPKWRTETFVLTRR